MDEEVIDAFNSLPNSNKKSNGFFPEHSFDANCLKAGITLVDLEKRSFVSIMKVLFSFANVDNKTKNETAMATQADIDAFMK